MSAVVKEDLQAYKMTAARAALNWVTDDCVLGVGTGSTVDCFISMLANHPRKPSAFISSSDRTTAALAEVGIKTTTLSEVGSSVDVYIDGADEFTRDFYLIKGGGGAHTREKIIAAASRKFVVIADPSKEVNVLGRFPVAVEVLPMARSFVAQRIAARGGSTNWREGFVTEEGNVILDCVVDCVDAHAQEIRLSALPGVVDCGLFTLRPADTIIIGGENDDRVEIINRFL